MRETDDRPATTSPRSDASPDFRRLRGASAMALLACESWVAEHGVRGTLGGAPRRRRTPPMRRARIRTSRPRLARAASEGGISGPERAKKYDFYQMLPNFEKWVASRQERRTRTSRRRSRRRRPKIRAAQRGLRACRRGSYRNETDADRVRAQLALCRGSMPGYSASRVDTDVWHRVRIGPISNLDRAQQGAPAAAGGPRSMRW